MSLEYPEKRSSRVLIVQPSNSNVELKDLKKEEESSTPAVLKVDISPTVRISESYEDEIDLPKKKKWWKKESDENEDDEKKAKAVPIWKLFRYATWFDWILITLSLIFAIGHGAALPGAMYAFGDLTNLYVNYDISRRIFDDISDQTEIVTEAFTYNDSIPTLSVQEAFDKLTLTPGTLVTEEDLTQLQLLLYNLSNSSSQIEGASCVIFTFANESDTTVYEFMNQASTDGANIRASSRRCDCLRDAFNDFSTEARCLSTNDFIYGEGGLDGILWQIYIFIMIAGGVLIAAYIQISFIQTACERQIKKIRLNYYRAVLRQDISWFDVNPSGEVSSRLNDDIDKIHAGIGDKFAILVQWVATFFAGFAIGFSRDWRLTLFLIAVTPLLAIAAAGFSKILAAFTSEEQKLYATAGAIAEEVLQSVSTVVAFGGEYKELERYEAKLADARKLGTKKGASVGVSFAVIYFVLFASYAGAFWFGGFLIQEELLQAGDMLAVFFAVIIGAFSLGQAAPNAESLVTAAGAAGEIFETIDREPPIDSSSNEGFIPRTFEPAVKFADVCFSYPARSEVQVLNGLDLEIKIGQTVALVGPSGCGKSTVVQLLQRFYDIAGGLITVDGHDIKDLNLKWLRGNIGVVSQEPVLFDTSITENIRYGKDNATMAQIEAAAKAANAYNFISELPEGFKTIVGEKGTQLSGGQKQRIAIARALVRDPKILLLDEATSALDTESEKIVQEALDKAREGRTTIVIAHRLSTIQTADVIAGIEGGRVVEMGTHAELMNNKGLYFELVTAQSYGDTDDVVSKKPVKRELSRLKRTRSRHTSESEKEEITKKGSIKIRRQLSREYSKTEQVEESISDKKLEKLQEEWDKDIPEVQLTRVLKANAPEWWVIIFGLFGSLILGSIFPLFAIIFGEILEVFARPSSEILNALHLWAALFIVLGLVSGFAAFLKSVCFTVAGENLTARLRAWSFKAMMRQEIGWYDVDRNSSGILATRLSQDASRVQGATGTRLGTLLETFIALGLSLIIALVYSWLLTLVLLTLVPVMLVAGFLQLKALTGHAGANKEALEQAGKIAVDSMDNMRTVASLGVEPNFFNAYHAEINKPYKRSLLNTIVYGLTYGFSQGIIFLGYALAFGFGAYQVTQDTDHIAYVSFDSIFIVFTAVIFGAVGAGQAGSFAPNYTHAKLSANRIFALLDREPVIDGYSKDGSTIDKVVADIHLDGVEFSYPARPEVQVLQGLNISVKPGQTLALVGPSGCGKSTVVSLLERFYDPSGGSLKLDSNDIRDLNIRWLRHQIGIVSQEPVLFNTSIADNIRYGANFRDVSDEEVIEAAKAANIHNFIQTLPEGYSTNAGSKGTQLSGGQKQRIAIARALVRDPKILLLDEATSALDTESEKIVQEALDKAREGRTTIVIAHRLSTIYNSDCIAVISNGKIREKGTHTELMALKGIYYTLNQYQVQETEEEEQEERRRKISASVKSDGEDSVTPDV